MKAAALLQDAPTDTAAQLSTVQERLESRMADEVGAEFASRYLEGIPEWDVLPGGVNIRKILWLHNLLQAYELESYAKARYNMLSRNDHWFPGEKARDFDDAAILSALADAPMPKRFQDACAKLTKP